MGFCIMEEIIEPVNNNYRLAMQRYSQKRKEVLNKIKNEYDISGNDFIDILKQEFKKNMSQSMTSELTGRSVKIDTLLKHLYNAAEAQALALVDSHSEEIEREGEIIDKIRQNTEGDIIAQKKQFDREIDSIVYKFANEISLNNVWNKYLPELMMSDDNKKLATAQILGYCKSIFKREIQKRLALDEIDNAVRRHPAIILGYIREDAVADAAQKAIKHFKMSGAKAKTVGAEQSHIDILISLSGKTTSKVSNDIMDSLLNQLDSIGQSFVTIGESKFENENFLGIQSKAWNLYAPSNEIWNPNALGRRAELFNDFVATLSSDLEGKRAWHKGVLYISNHLEEAMGPNTLIYATGKQILWTNELLETMLNNNKYFAFRLNSENKVTPTVVLADHYG